MLRSKLSHSVDVGLFHGCALCSVFLCHHCEFGGRLRTKFVKSLQVFNLKAFDGRGVGSLDRCLLALEPSLHRLQGCRPMLVMLQEQAFELL